jgi:transcription initiation factor IIE alpha subunit
MRPYGQLADLILNLLKEFGAMTSFEIAQSLGMTKTEISGVLSRLHKTGARTPRRIYITNYVHDAEGSRRYPRAVYALGCKLDAPKPKSNIKANKKRYLQKKNARVNSVWMLGMSRQQRRDIGMAA